MWLLLQRKQPWIQVGSPKFCLCTAAPFCETKGFCVSWREMYSESMAGMKMTFAFKLNCLWESGSRCCFQVRAPINTSEPNLFRWRHFKINTVQNAKAIRWAGEPWHPVTASLRRSLHSQWISTRKFSASERSSCSSSSGGRENVEILIKRRKKKNTLSCDLLLLELSRLLLQDFQLKRYPETLSGREAGLKGAVGRTVLVAIVMCVCSGRGLEDRATLK